MYDNRYNYNYKFRNTECTTTSDFAEVAQVIHEADHLLFTAGAGMGVDSGLPDFRGSEGFWKAYPMLKGKGFASMANPEHFEKNPSVGWGFYGHRLNLYRETVPHRGFDILKRLAELKNNSYFIYTSNVDGAYQKAGFSEDKIVECHGSIHWLQTMSPNGKIISANPFEVEVDENLKAVGDLPRDVVGRLLRPNILMFGDWGWDSTRTEKQYTRMENFLKGKDLSKVAVIEVGAGTSIPSVRMMGRRFQNNGATLVRINPREPQDGCYTIALGGLEALEKLEPMLF